ncbi:MAG: deoxyhypusine synthase [Desulfurococcales archaeon]|nr:deoxyhypusine synthase [Desulfurococcales archaeon]
MFEEVRDARVSPSMTLRDLIEAYRGMHGFMAGHLAEAVEVLREGLRESRLRVLSFTANLVATGLRGVLAQLVDSGLFDVVITTAGALDHDIARGTGGRYLRGRFEADDAELYERGYHRLGNVFIPIQDYGPKVEAFVRDLVAEARRRGGERWPLYKLLGLAGEMLDARGARDSILASAWRRGVEVFVPGWPDGAFGTALFMEAQRGNRVEVDYYEDMKRLADHFFPREGKAAALIVGGGISKHHTIWWSQFREGLDYVVYVTTAVEYDGSLSGAHPREAVTWGKVKPRARRAVVYGDATLILPIIAAGLLEGLS